MKVSSSKFMWALLKNWEWTKKEICNRSETSNCFEFTLGLTYTCCSPQSLTKMVGHNYLAKMLPEINRILKHICCFCKNFERKLKNDFRLIHITEVSLKPLYFHSKNRLGYPNEEPGKKSYHKLKIELSVEHQPESEK